MRRDFVWVLSVLLMIPGCLLVSTGNGDASDDSSMPAPSAAESTPSLQRPDLPAQTLTSATEGANFVNDLVGSLRSRDFAGIREKMGDTFILGYWNGESGEITSQDATMLILSEFAVPPSTIALLTDIDSAVYLQEASSLLGDARSTLLFSTGWGADGQGQAILGIGRNENDAPYWLGMIYSPVAIIAPTPAPSVSPVMATAAPSFSPPPPTYGPLIYESTMRAGWPEFQLPEGSTSLTTAGYLVEALVSIWVYSTRVAASDFYAEIRATPEYCPPDTGSYGLLFHYVSDTEFRFFTISCDGEFTLLERTSASSSRQLTGGILPEPIDAKSDTHVLAIQAADNSILLVVDGYVLAETNVGFSPTGDIGIYADTTSGPMRVLFADLRVFQTLD